MNPLIEVIVSFLLFPFRLVKSLLFAIKGYDRYSDSHAKNRIYADFEVLETEKGDYKEWIKDITNNRIGIVLGARGSGKTAIGLRILENTNKKAFAIGFNSLPKWIKCVEDISNVEEDSFVLIDEGGIIFSSRSSMAKPNKILSELILLSRHKNISILFISQNSSNLDVNILRQADYLILKPSSLMQLDFERKKIKMLYTQTASGFEKYKDKKGLAYIYSEKFCGFVSNPLPSFWTKDISLSFKGKTI